MSAGPFSCPLPIAEHDRVLLAHGGGGRLMHRLIRDLFCEAFRGLGEPAAHDAAVMDFGGERLAFTTDSFVVRPLEFPGGDIGRLAVLGTVNDLAMAGAEPLAISVGFILEEGLSLATLARIASSVAQAGREAGVRIATGDTKVVEHGRGDGLYVNTSGIGRVRPGVEIRPERVVPGDAVVLSGDVGRHGMAVLASREGLGFESSLESDAAFLWPAVRALLEAGVEVHCLRDATRGGLASALHEIASAAGVTIRLEEALIPVSEEVRGACELLGLDPLYVACEGRFVALVPGEQAEAAAEALRRVPVAAGAVPIGAVTRPSGSPLVLRSVIGVDRVLDLLSGEQLPRIC